MLAKLFFKLCAIQLYLKNHKFITNPILKNTAQKLSNMNEAQKE